MSAGAVHHAARPPLVGWLATLVPLGCFLWLMTHAGVVADGQPVRLAWDWVPSLGVTLSLYIDGLSLLFGLLIAGIGVFVFLYAGSYLAGHPRVERFFLYLTGFQLSMLGLVLGDNLITLFVFWELTSLTSFLLIGFDSDNPTSRRNALQALLVTACGGLAMLAGFILLAQTMGSYELSEILAGDVGLVGHALYLPIAILILIGAFTKSAQFPFHFWLPNAMSAPTPVSAYLHSATMVKGGIYLMARLQPVLGGSDFWTWTLTLVGAGTAVMASLLALRETDLKRMLAYTTLMALGTLTMFLGNETTVAIAAAVTFILVHSLYKATLFLVIGIIDHESGTRQLGAVGGLARAMPITTAAAGAAAFSMAGFPPFLGFIGKELKYEGALAVASEPLLVAMAAVGANALMVCVALVVFLRPFFGPRVATPKAPHEAPWTMWIGPAVLAVFGLTFGIDPDLVSAALVTPAVQAVTGGPATISLYLWHGINLPLLMSVVTVALGALAYWQFGRLSSVIAKGFAAIPVSGDSAYDAVMAGLVRVARWQTDLLQSGVLRRYMITVVVVLIAAVAGTLWLRDGWSAGPPLEVGEFYTWPVIGLIIAGTAVTVVTHSRLAAICALGTVGTAVALIFMMYGAPDVAMTQLLVEILVVVIVTLVMLRLPGFHGIAHPGRAGRIRDIVLAVLAGVVVTGLMLAVLAEPLDRRITDYYEITSVPEAFGRNIVNVVLVDFRALDTFGEIAVVGIAGFACYALIRARRRATSANGGRRT